MTLLVDSEMPTNTGFGVGTSTGIAPSSPQTFSFTNTAGTVLYLIVILSVQSGGSTSFGTVSYNGVTMTNILNEPTGTGASRLGIFRLLSPATGANTVSIAHTMATSTNFTITAGAISFTGNDMVTPEKQAAVGANGTSLTSSASLTGVTAGNITIAGHGGGTNFSSSSATLSWANNFANTSQAGNGRSNRSTASGSVSLTATLAGSDSWAAGIVEVAAAGAALFVAPHTFTAIPVQAQGRNL